MTAASASPARPVAATAGRLDVIDAARGAAVGLMVIYHLCWDLSYFGFVQFDLLTNPWWLAFRTLILGSFLAIAGFVQVLAHGEGVRPVPFLRRLGLLVASAAAITLASWLVFPDSYIFFGVLHCLALASVLTLGIQRLPVPLILAAAGFCIVAPALFAQPLFDRPWLYWLGLVTEVPVSNDYVPILPWFGVTLLGVAAGRVVAVDLDNRLPAVTWRSSRPAEKTLCWSGRHSLLVYLVHQPVLLGLLYAATLVVEVERPDALSQAKAAFSRDCYASCAPNAAAATPPLDCRAYCACIGDGLTVADLWPQVLEDSLTRLQEGRVAGLVAQCMRP